MFFVFSQVASELLRRAGESDGSSKDASKILSAYKTCVKVSLATHLAAVLTRCGALSHSKQSAVVAPEVKQAVDFFGRAIVAKALTASQEAGKLHFLFSSLPVLDSDHPCCLVAALLAPPPPKKIKQTMYKFNEGFSNAVRTTKRVSDFFA